MNVLITGGAGFIGSHLADRLLREGTGHRVVCVDDLSTGSLDNIHHLLGRKDFRFVRDSVRNLGTMTSLVDHCDVIFHLAAAVGVKLIVDEPVRTIETNIHGSEVMLELACKFGRKILLASSSEVYGKGEKVPFCEDDDIVLGSTRYSRWCYACSKMVDEFLALAYFRQFGLPTVVCRFFNTVGPRQTGMYGMVIPRFVRWALKGQPLEVYGQGTQKRSFGNVSDVVGAIERLMECDAAVGQVINVGTDQSTSINELADTIIQMTGSTAGKRYISYEQAYGQPFDDLPCRVPDLSRLRRLIDYKSQVPLRQTLEQVIAYEKGRK
jgi:UDP-glucose 4-epimerase